MASWNENWSNIGCSYFGDPCPYCGGPYLGQKCASKSDVWNFYNVCGCQGGHWDDCPNFYHPSRSSYYNVSNNVYEFYRSNEVEDMESADHIMDMIRQIAEQHDMMMRQVAEQQNENRKAIQRISEAIMRMMAEAEEVAEEREFPPEDNLEEADIVIQSWL